MKSFNEWLEIRDPELLSEINWRKALATGALAASSLLPGGYKTLAAEPTAPPPAAATAAERPTYTSSGEGYFDYMKGTGVGGGNIDRQKLYQQGYEGIEAEETLKTDVIRTLKSISGKQIGENVTIKEVYVKIIELEKDAGLSTSRITVYGAVKAEVLIEVHVEISGPSASQEMANKIAKMAAEKVLNDKGFKYRRVKDVIGARKYGTKDIVRSMDIGGPEKYERGQDIKSVSSPSPTAADFLPNEQTQNAKVFKVELRYEITR